MRKRTLVIFVVAAAALAALGAAILLVWGLLGGGTPIIIKGFGDPAGDLTIDGSPDANRAIQAHGVKKDHTRLDEISRLFVLEGNGKCTAYVFSESNETRITIDVKGANEEIDLTNNKDLKQLNLRFDDVDTYQKTRANYKRKQAAAIEKVNVVFEKGTECTDEGGNSKSCPPQVPITGSGQLTIAVNYRGKACKP